MSDKPIKVKWSQNHGTAQIYSSGVELALCSDDNKQVGPLVFCKDFFQDAIVASLHGTVCSIYGYKYDSSFPPIPKDNLKVLLTNAADPKLKEKIPAVSDFLNQIEAELGVEKTVIEQCEKPPDKYAKCGIYLLIADKKWMHAPPLLSLWTLLARNSLVHKVGNKWRDTLQSIISGKTPASQKHDRTYIEYGKPGLDLVLEKGIEALFGKVMKANYPKEKAGHAMHHYSGIVSYGSCKAKSHFPMWQYPAKASNPPSVCFA